MSVLNSAENAPEGPGLFDWLAAYQRVDGFISEGCPQKIGPFLKSATADHRESRYRFVLLGMVFLRMGDPSKSLSSFCSAINCGSDEPFPGIDSPATSAYIRAQLARGGAAIEPSDSHRDILQKNLSGLRERNASLAETLDNIRFPADMCVLDIWGCPHLYEKNTHKIMGVDDALKATIQPVIKQGFVPLMFAGSGSGQLMSYCMSQSPDGEHQMARAHYLFEEDYGKIIAHLSLYDCSDELRREKLIIFAGPTAVAQAETLFGTLRYPISSVVIGKNQRVKSLVDDFLQRMLDFVAYRQAANRYYRGCDFESRLKDVVEGKTQPRVLFFTSRFTAFLQHGVADIQKGMGRIGCETQLLIEQSDVQRLQPGIFWRTINEFKPDLIVSVSHTRLTYADLIPTEVPFVSYVMDKIGAVVTQQTIGDKITGLDLFPCMMQEFQRYLIDKGVPEKQTYIMTPPADEFMFYPLKKREDIAPSFIADVSFVKQGQIDKEKLFSTFVHNRVKDIKDPFLKNTLASVLTDLYLETCNCGNKRIYEDQMQAYCRDQFKAGTPELLAQLNQLITIFFIVVHSHIWRYSFLEALDKAGINLVLYGNHWERNGQFSHLAGGLVKRGPDLNAVYNGSNINLHIHPTCTMHQRINECGLAGGFILAADHDPKMDWEPVKTYYQPGREIVMFHTAEELVEKCHYFLKNEDERRDIAERMHERAVTHHTTKVEAKRILTKWRGLASSVSGQIPSETSS